VALDRFMRRLYRSTLLNAERTGATLPPNPLAPGNEAGFLAWLLQTPDERPDARLNRYLAAVYAERPDLQKAFPDPDGANFQSFATWVRHEVQEGRLDTRFSDLPLPPSPTRLRLNAAMQLARVERRVTAVPVPGTGNQRVRLNMAGSLRRLDRVVTAAPLPASADRMQVNLSRSLGRLERRLAAVPVPGTGNERVRLNLAKWLGRAQRRLTVVPNVKIGSQRPSAEGTVREELAPGIRVSGYLRTESGVGELGRLALATVEKAGIATASYVDTNAPSRQRHPFEPSGLDLNVNLICVNADELPNFARRVGPAFFTDHYTIGLWAWELEEFPHKFAASFDYVDEIWSISEFARQAIATISTKPVYAFPLPIVEPQVDMTVGRSQLGLPDGFMFLFCFDLLSIFERKNPLGLIEAYSKAFRPGEGPLLVIKAVNGQFEAGSLERLKLAASRRPDIIVLDKYLDPETNMALMVASDCYVSLHRSEGFGLTMAEAMALGKPVIATAYSGNLDFMTADTSYLVPWAPGKVPIGCSPYRAGARWAEPDLDAAAQIMRKVYNNPLLAAEIGRRAKPHVLADHGLDTRASFVLERFDAAQAQLLERNRYKGRTESSAAAVTTSPIMDTARRPRDLDVPSNHPHAARVYRRLVWRALRSHDDHDREVHVQLAGAIDELSTEMAVLRAESDRFEALGTRAHTALRADIEGQQELLDSQQPRLDAQEQRLERLEAPERWRKLGEAIATSEQLHAIPFMTKPEMLLATSSDGRPAIGYREGSELSDGYASFEDVFRGPEEMIRERLRPYISLLIHHSPVLDVGCGRGEMLDLLSRSGIDAMGVDIDPAMVQRAKGKGHQVIQQDAVEYLAAQPSASLGAVFAAQVIEHLQPDALLRLLLEAQRALRPGGVLILETVNPYSIQAFKAFWTDLTHRNPIYPEALTVYCAEAGFQEALVMFPNGSGDLASDRWTEGEYAVVARKKT
jgi:SAM-dependent methyltransferase/glycosyltransferase involved in cell wall biosynthesis